MFYHTQAFADLTGVSPRTLRYYHQRGLLVPSLDDNGYRRYSSAEADRLQLILMYRQLGFSLDEIAHLLQADAPTRRQALLTQRQHLLSEQAALNQRLAQLDATLNNQPGGTTMTDEEKFAAFKADQIAANDAAYGEEVTAQYGQAAKTAADRHWAHLTSEQYAALQAAEARLRTQLQTYLKAPVLPSETAKAAFAAHREWLQIAAPNYSPALHRGIGALYQSDDRFGDYYRELTGQPGAAAALSAIIAYYTH
ncbi:MAG: MerR family transcriptional regulator [Lactobacillus sp.]|jgi:DNA-binding transcriptional MerR regulator|nr:MerR family transcriptional regulator [Lactobacillus sp.]MCI2033600.1 MerR family transcriptional regulator [Lactobacillus sp.]